MKKKLTNILFAFIFVAGLLTVSYPLISDYLSSKKQNDVVVSYVENISHLSKDEYDKIINQARDYNLFISQYSKIMHALNAEKSYTGAKYEELLNLGNLGVLRIPSIDVELPIYHGTEEAILQVGVGHYRGSSLPIGGNSTHTVLTGHTGLPSSRLLTDIDQMKTGDLFYIQVLNETIAYEVDQVKIVLPDELSDINIVQDEDYATLVTCTPYGINSHRLLVRGKRVSYVELQSHLGDEVTIISGILIIGILIIVFLLLRSIYRKGKRK